MITALYKSLADTASFNFLLNIHTLDSASSLYTRIPVVRCELHTCVLVPKHVFTFPETVYAVPSVPSTDTFSLRTLSSCTNTLSVYTGSAPRHDTLGHPCLRLQRE